MFCASVLTMQSTMVLTACFRSGVGGIEKRNNDEMRERVTIFLLTPLQLLPNHQQALAHFRSGSLPVSTKTKKTRSC